MQPQMVATGGSAAANGVSESGGGGSGSGSGGGNGNGGPCGACKFLRRKCVNGCIFAPFFDPDQGAMHFAAVHKVFGASNVSKLLVHLPVHKRLEAIVTICYEAEARIRDPVYGCTSHIFALQQQVVDLQSEVSRLRARLATLQTPTPQPFVHLPSHLTFLADIQSASSYHSTCDLDSLLDTSVQSLMQQEQHQEGEFQQLGAVDEGSIFNDHPFTGEEYQLMLDELVEKNKLGSPKPPPSMSK